MESMMVVAPKPLHVRKETVIAIMTKNVKGHWYVDMQIACIDLMDIILYFLITNIEWIAAWNLQVSILYLLAGLHTLFTNNTHINYTWLK